MVSSNAMWGAGAEAVSIQQAAQVGPTTFDTCGGFRYLVNITPVSPTSSSAIGDSNAVHRPHTRQHGRLPVHQPNR